MKEREAARVTRVRFDAVGATEDEVFSAIDEAAKLIAPLGESRVGRSEIKTTTQPGVPARGWKIFEIRRSDRAPVVRQ